MWSKFGNSSITTREVIITLILQRFIFEGCSWFKFNNLGLALGMALKFYTNVTKDLTVWKFRGLIPTFVEVAWEKLVGGVFLDQKNPSWANFVQKSKTVCSKRSLIQKVIRIQIIQWYCPFYLFELTFLHKFVPRNQNGQFELKIGSKTNSNVKNSMVMFIFPVFDRKYPLFHDSKFFVEAAI